VPPTPLATSYGVPTITVLGTSGSPDPWWSITLRNVRFAP
jgi:hypothetical protein